MSNVTGKCEYCRKNPAVTERHGGKVCLQCASGPITSDQHCERDNRRTA